uniref:ATP synthase complex subunit 8 n=1 Tax=Habrophlebiodes zijinensis TaxID=289472 RepID=A0A0B4IKD6_9INSE|nr:ATP synthase F0 subunit 8 [Habrophlebiodes zijinensis]
MAPLSWLLLFMIFSLTFIFFNIMNYFNFTPNNPSLNSNFNFNSSNPLNWLW